MSKDIYNEKVDIQLSESADIYMPHVKKVRGVIDGEEYELLINERDLPAGIAPSGATITKIIPWDKKFYMEWEIQGSPVFDVVVSDGGADVVRLEGYEQKNGIFDQQSLTNGTQYDIQVFADILNIATESNIENVTLFDATPTGLSLSVGSDTVTASWDNISQVSAWEVTLKDSEGVQVDKVTKLQGATSATLEGVEPYNNYTVELQAFSEGKVFSSSVVSEAFNTQRVVYVAGFNELIAYSLEDGSQIAVTSAGDEWGEYGMDHDPIRNRLVTADEYGRIRCFDVNSDWTISQIWSYLPTSNSAGNPIFDYEGDVYIGDYENSASVIVKLDGSDGSKLWSTDVGQDDSDISAWNGFGLHPLGIVVGANTGKVGFISPEGDYIKTVTLPDDGGGILSTNYCRTPQCDEFGHFYVWSTGTPASGSERGVGRYLDSKTSTPGATIDWFRSTGYNTHIGWIGKDHFSRLRRYGGINVYRKDDQSYKYNADSPDTYDEFRIAWDELHHIHGFDADDNLLYEDSANGNNLSSRAPDGTLNWTVDIGTIYTVLPVPTSKPYPWTDTAADLSLENLISDGLDITVEAWSSNPSIEYALYDQAGTTQVVSWQKSRHLTAPSAGTYTVKVRDRVQTTPETDIISVAPATNYVTSNGIAATHGQGRFPIRNFFTATNIKNDIPSNGDTGQYENPIAFLDNGDIVLWEGTDLVRFTQSSNYDNTDWVVTGFALGTALSLDIDIDGNIIIIGDSSGDNMFKVDPADGSKIWTRDTARQFSSANDFALDSSGNIYVTDGDELVRYDSNGQNPTVIYTDPGNHGLRRLTIDLSENMFITNTNGDIRKIDKSGTQLQTVSGYGNVTDVEALYDGRLAACTSDGYIYVFTDALVQDDSVSTTYTFYRLDVFTTNAIVAVAWRQSSNDDEPLVYLTVDPLTIDQEWVHDWLRTEYVAAHPTRRF